MPSRSFFWGNWQFPVCARCTGVLLGQLLMVVALFFGARTKMKTNALFLGVMGIDWLLQRCNMCPSTNTRRLVTGTLAGAALTSVYAKVLGIVQK